MTATATIIDVPAAETDAFGDPFDDGYSSNEKFAPSGSAQFQQLSDATHASIDAAEQANNATTFTNTTDAGFVSILDLENEYAIFANGETGNLEVSLAADGSQFIAEDGFVRSSSSLNALYSYHGRRPKLRGSNSMGLECFFDCTS